MSRQGRPKNKAFEELEFTLIKQVDKYKALCNYCEKVLSNTSSSRLLIHRKTCKKALTATSTTNATLQDRQCGSGNSEVIEIEEMEVLPERTLTPIPTDTVSPSTSTNSTLTLDNAGLNAESNINLSFARSTAFSGASENTSSSSSFSAIVSDASTSNSIVSDTPKSTKIKKNSMLTRFVDKLEKRDEEEITDAIGDFFFGCNIPLLNVELVHFKNLIKKLRPAYVEKIPGRKQLSTTILNKSYDKCISKARNALNKESVLLIDGWKNCSNNSKTVVSMIHTSDGKQAFLDAWDLTTESETGEKLSQIVSESIDLAKNLYNTDIYAVVSDNASPMLKMGKLMKHAVWHTTCNSHTGNLLAKDVTNKKLNEKVSTVLKEFKHPHLEKLIVDKGGHRIKLPAETRWCSYRDSNQCLLKNLQYMKLIAADAGGRKIKQNVSQLIFDDDFVQEVKESVELYNPICHLIDKCQSVDFSLADAAELWLDLQLPEKYQYCLKERKKIALNELAIAAYYFHPYYDNEKLSREQKKQLNHFLLTHLSGEGLEECDKYNTKSEVFETLYEKDIRNPLVFWRLAEIHYPNVSKLAVKLLNIPASSAQLERVFSTWAIIHTPIRNRLTFDRSKKLMHVYYTLRMSDNIVKDVHEEMEDV